MATVAQLLALVDSMYPNVESVDEKINYMNMAQNNLSAYFGMVIEDDTTVTVADQDSYEYPTGVTDISQIISLAVAGTDSPLNRYDYTEYKQNYSRDNPMSDYGYFQIYDSSGAKKFVLCPEPETSGYTIIIRYKQPLTELTSNTLTAEPEFDSKYHSLLALYCCHMICAKGSSPDWVQADMFMQKYENQLAELWLHKVRVADVSQKRPRDNPQWHKSKSYSNGF